MQTLPAKTLQSKLADVEVTRAVVLGDGAECIHQLRDNTRGHHVPFRIVEENVVFAKSSNGARDNAN